MHNHIDVAQVSLYTKFCFLVSLHYLNQTYIPSKISLNEKGPGRIRCTIFLVLTMSKVLVTKLCACVCRRYPFDRPKFW